MDCYDVIIIGTGAGGGTLAHALAPTGKRILLLERGDYVRREKDNWDPAAVNVEGRYQTKETWQRPGRQALHPHTNYYVGGNTKFYGAALFRLRKEDFGELRHHGGVSPAWPITYDELEPYYTKAERLYHVHGKRGEDPTEPPASAPYPHPAVSHEPRIQQLSDDFAALGLQPFHVAARRHARREQPRRRAPASAATPATASRAWCTPSPTPQVCCVEPALAPPERDAAHRRLASTRLETSAVGPRGDRRAW